jgi:hypothetical protein
VRHFPLFSWLGTSRSVPFPDVDVDVDVDVDAGAERNAMIEVHQSPTKAGISKVGSRRLDKARGFCGWRGLGRPTNVTKKKGALFRAPCSGRKPA